jgi:DNA helicase II / ATP-dependent DNA helicase PcrA
MMPTSRPDQSKLDLSSNEASREPAVEGSTGGDPLRTSIPAVTASGSRLSISQRAMAHTSGAGGAPYLAGLNAEQRAAVEALDGPVLVLAGAGTGKTKVLTARIAHLLATGRAKSHQILSVTFTNKAAREMKERIAKLVPGAGEGMPWLGTFHSIGVKILRRHAELADLKSDFTILDTDDQLRLLKQLIEAANIDAKRWPARHLANLIDGWKNKGITPDKVPAGDAAAFGNGQGAALYKAYQARLKELNAADFGDLLLEGLRIFLAHPDVLAQYHGRFRYLLVDEYQDTNVVQYLWLRLLAQGNGGSSNICCVGDDDQSIYGWRGAEVDNILKFEKDFPGAKVIKLERNYRSTSHILATASHLITHNKGRLGKTLFTDDQSGGEKVAVQGVWDDEEEARTVAGTIERLQKTGHKLNDMAILVRASFQMRAFEDRFVTTGLPYRVIGGPRFYERAEIKDACAYLELVANPANDLKFERIVNVPTRGLGDATIKLIRAHARARELPLVAASRELIESEELKPRPRRALADLIGMFERWRKLAVDKRHTDLAGIILDESGYTAMWQKDKTPQAHSRLENLKELIRFMDEFETLPAFLEHVALVMDVETDHVTDRVTLMTLHAAKGLEFDTVFLPGWEEGLFPHQRSLDESGLSGLEEERRLAYVGITRAKKRARISFTQNRRVHALWQSAMPSRFIDELPEDHVEVIEAESRYGGTVASRFQEPAAGFASPYGTPGWQRAQQNWKGGADAGGTKASSQGSSKNSGFSESGPAFNRWDSKQSGKAARGPQSRGPMTIDGELVAKSTGTASPHVVGARVFHDKFGYGQVLDIEGNKLTVSFDKAGEKKVLDSFVMAA